LRRPRFACLRRPRLPADDDLDLPAGDDLVMRARGGSRYTRRRRPRYTRLRRPRFACRRGRADPASSKRFDMQTLDRADASRNRIVRRPTSHVGRMVRGPNK
jgi:hypothetical protein